MSVKHRMYGTDGRQLDLVVHAPQLLADLRRTPARMLLAQPHNECLDLKRQLVRVPVGTTGSIIESLGTTIFIALVDLVARLARDIELSAQDRHLLPVQQPGHKTHPLFHFGTLLPRHFASPAKAEKCYLCARNAVLPMNR